MRRVDSALVNNLARWARFESRAFIQRSRLTRGGRGLLGRRSRLRVHRGGSMTVGTGFVSGDDVLVSAIGTLRIGDNLFVNSFSRIVARELVEIGDNVVIASDVSVLDHDHRTHARDGNLVIEKAEYTTAPIRIGNNVWLGDKVTVLKGVTIGDNAIVGANAVVTKDVEPGTIVGGIPATVIRKIDLS